MIRYVPKYAADGKTLTKKLLAKRVPKAKRYTGKAIDIVDTKLCDDIIQYLAPTLEQHKGCTLVDINPGASVFSSKLHDFLKPKSHILFEPNLGYFEPFLKPLLDKPGSTYRYVEPMLPDRRIFSWYAFRETFDLEVTTGSQPTKSNQFNPNVLVVVNVAKWCRFGEGDELYYPFGMGVLRQLSSDVLARELFNMNGTARTLCWLPEKYKSYVLPHYSYGRFNLSTSMEMAYDISEVAGVKSTAEVKLERGPRHRERKRSGVFYDINREVVARRMQKLGLVLPPGGRQFQDVFPSTFAPGPGVEQPSPLDTNVQSVDDLRDHIHNAETRLRWLSKWAKLPIRQNYKSAGYQGWFEGAIKTLKYPQCALAPKCYPSHDWIKVRKQTFVVLSDMLLRMVNLEAGHAELNSTKMSGTESDELRMRIKATKKQFWNIVGTETYLIHILEDFVDDHITFYSSSPIAGWDRRAYEPLQAESSDFLPKRDMTLLDLMPRDVDLSVTDLATHRESTAFCYTLLRNLFGARAANVPLALEKAIGVNAGQDLIPMVPEITDVRKGGRLDPKDLKVRMLTPEMIEGLVKAFFEWPFKPDGWKTYLKHHGGPENDENPLGKTELSGTESEHPEMTETSSPELEELKMKMQMSSSQDLEDLKKKVNV